MKNYRLRLQLSVSGNKENTVIRIVEAGQALGFTFEGDADRSLSISEAIETTMQEECVNFILDDAAFVFYVSRRISSYLQLLDFPERKNTILVNSLVHASKPDEILSDGKELFVKVIEHNYKFIFDPHSKQDTFSRPLPILEAYQILDTMQAKETYKFYLIVENYVVSLEIAPETISLVAQEPIKLKTVDGQQDYDRAFYVRILLNLLKNIGIDELICTL